MAVPTDELSLFIRDWYYAASEAQSEAFLGFFLDSPETVYLGSDPQESWYGIDEIRANFLENFKTYGKWTVMSKDLRVYQAGEVAYFTDEVEFSARLGGSSIAEDARMSGVLIKKDGKWKIAQAHFSFGVPNQQLLPG
jgi:ketosteroid isomerase-like protein